MRQSWHTYLSDKSHGEGFFYLAAVALKQMGGKDGRGPVDVPGLQVCVQHRRERLGGEPLDDGFQTVEHIGGGVGEWQQCTPLVSLLVGAVPCLRSRFHTGLFTNRYNEYNCINRYNEYNCINR